MSQISRKMRDWTVLVYQGNGCFGKFGTHQNDLLELQQLPPSDRVAFVTQGHEDYKKDVLVRREIGPVSNRWGITEPIDKVEGRQNEAEQLTDFVKWGLSEYPSKRTCLVISGYAGGPNGVIADEKDGLVPLIDIKKGLADGLDGKELDILAFDGNWMACIEAASEFVGTADLMVASQGRMESWDYTERFSELVKQPDSDTDALASQLVKADKGSSGMSVHWLDEVPNAEFWLDHLWKEAKRSGYDGDSLDDAQDVSHFKDLHSVIGLFSEGRSRDSLWEIAMEAESALDDVALEQGGLPELEVGGVNVGVSYADAKEGESFRSATGWDDFLDSRASDTEVPISELPFGPGTDEPFLLAS